MMKTKITAIAGALSIAALAPMQSHADLLFTVGAKANVWDATPSGTFDGNTSVEDENNGLGLEPNQGNQYEIFIEHPLPVIPNIRIMQTDIDFKGSGNLTTTFNGSAFGGPVESQFDLSHTDYTAFWGLPLPIPMIDINIGLTARTLDGFIIVENESTLGAAGSREEVTLDQTLPLLFGQVKLDTPVGIYGYADVNYIGYDGNDISDLRYALGYALPLPLVDLGVEIGYRAVSLKTNEDSIDIETDIDIDGTYLGLSFSVGL